MVKRILLITIVIILGLDCYGQDNIIEFDYHKADSIALNVPKANYKTITEIANVLTKNLNTDYEKFRAIFRWIADSIDYSFSNISSDPELVVRKGMAVCAGYSYLLRSMCNSIGLDCIIVNGYAKNQISDIGKEFKKTNHAWNAIKLNNKWYLVDLTWASGVFDLQTNKFFKKFDSTYFLADPDYFYKNHHPENYISFIPNNKMRMSKFINSPIYYCGLKNNNIKTVSPSKGKIILKLKDPLKIIIETDKDIKNIYFGLTNEKYRINPTVIIKDYKYILTYKFNNVGNKFLILFIDNDPVSGYKIKVKK